MYPSFSRVILLCAVDGCITKKKAVCALIFNYRPQRGNKHHVVKFSTDCTAGFSFLPAIRNARIHVANTRKSYCNPKFEQSFSTFGRLDIGAAWLDTNREPGGVRTQEPTRKTMGHFNLRGICVARWILIRGITHRRALRGIPRRMIFV